MKLRLALALGAALLLSAPGVAYAQEGRFMGGGTIFNFNQVCVNQGGWGPRPEQYSVRYHPNGVGNNGNRETLSFLSSNNAMSLTRHDGAFGRPFRPVSHTGIFSTGFTQDQGANSPMIRVLSRAPANVNANTRAPVRLRGQIRHFSGIRGCVVSFDVLVQQRI